MTYNLITEEADLSRLTDHLATVPRIALDLEAAGFHRYSDQVCLVQLSTPRETVLLDPFSLDLGPALRPVLEDPDVEVVMHGADYDIRLLDRDLSIHLKGLFDTQIAASLLGADAIGLANLLDKHLGIKLSKKHQRADWARRPLPEDMLDYAAADTRYLLELGTILASGLREQGREGWAKEEFELLEEIRWEEDEADPVTRVKGARDLSPRKVSELRAALKWRDRVARDKDRAPFRVAGDSVLLAVVLERPSSVDALGEMKGMSPRLARQTGGELLAALREVDALPDGAHTPYPRPSRDGGGRPGPEEEALANRIRELRTRVAESMELDRGVLLSNAQIQEIVRAAPSSASELQAVPGLRRWQAGILGDRLLTILT